MNSFLCASVHRSSICELEHELGSLAKLGQQMKPIGLRMDSILKWNLSLIQEKMLTAFDVRLGTLFRKKLGQNFL